MTNAAQFAGLTDQVATGPFHEFDPLFTEPEVTERFHNGVPPAGPLDDQGQPKADPMGEEYPTLRVSFWQQQLSNFQAGASELRPGAHAAINAVFGDSEVYAAARSSQGEHSEQWRLSPPVSEVATISGQGASDTLTPADRSWYNQRVSMIESSGGRASSNLYGFQSPTWNDFGAGGDIKNADNQKAAMNRLTDVNYKSLEKSIGRPPTPTELYMAHQQGAVGAAKLINNPDEPAGKLVPPSHITGNYGNPNMTAREYLETWSRHFGVQGNANNRSQLYQFSNPTKPVAIDQVSGVGASPED